MLLTRGYLDTLHTRCLSRSNTEGVCQEEEHTVTNTLRDECLGPLGLPKSDDLKGMYAEAKTFMLAACRLCYMRATLARSDMHVMTQCRLLTDDRGLKQKITTVKVCTCS